ncbi:hypothetical protein HDZ31DRAFT_67642 [Schizophyllum fasciatum]
MRDHVPPRRPRRALRADALDVRMATPRQLTEYLDQFIIGQENAKKVLSVGVYNHYNRVQANASYREAQEEAQREYEESARTIYDHALTSQHPQASPPPTCTP